MPAPNSIHPKNVSQTNFSNQIIDLQKSSASTTKSKASETFHFTKHLPHHIEVKDGSTFPHYTGIYNTNLLMRNALHKKNKTLLGLNTRNTLTGKRMIVDATNGLVARQNSKIATPIQYPCHSITPSSLGTRGINVIKKGIHCPDHESHYGTANSNS